MSKSRKQYQESCPRPLRRRGKRKEKITSDKVDTSLYGLYSFQMARATRQSSVKGAEEARKTLPALVGAAAKGRTTIITKHGLAVAAIVPIHVARFETKQLSLMSLVGSGKGLWGRDSASTIAKLREEWSR